MSTYEKLAIILAALALFWTIAYAVFNEIRRWRDRKPKIKIKPSYATIPNLYPGNPTLLIIIIRNKGKRLSILNGIHISVRGSQKQLFINAPRSDQSSPYELRPGDSYTCWFKKEDLLKEKIGTASWDKRKIRITVSDMAGWVYKSKRFILDLSKLS